MLLAGYLKPISKFKNLDFDEEDLEDYTYELLFPNSEVRISFKKLVIDLLAHGEDNSHAYKLGMISLVRW